MSHLLKNYLTPPPSHYFRNCHISFHYTFSLRMSHVTLCYENILVFPVLLLVARFSIFFTNKGEHFLRGGNNTLYYFRPDLKNMLTNSCNFKTNLKFDLISLEMLFSFTKCVTSYFLINKFNTH